MIGNEIEGGAGGQISRLAGGANISRKLFLIFKIFVPSERAKAFARVAAA
jgi:hypothetical protein